MHYNTHSYQSTPSPVLSCLPLKTIKNPQRHASNQNEKLPQIYNSTKMLMLSLIREERALSKHTASKDNPQLPFQTLQNPDSGRPNKSKSHSSVELIPKQGRIIFNKDSSFKIKRKYLVTCPSEHQEELPPSKKQGEASRVQKHEAHCSYAKRKQKNSLHLDKNSYTLLQLFDRIESLKRFFDNKSNIYNKIKRLETKETYPTQQEKQSAPTRKRVVETLQKNNKIESINTQKSDSRLHQDRTKISKVKTENYLKDKSSIASRLKTNSLLRKEIQTRVQDKSEIADIDALNRPQKHLVIGQEQLFEPWSSQQGSQFEQHSHFMKWA